MTDTTTTDRWTPGPWAATDYLGGGAVGPEHEDEISVQAFGDGPVVAAVWPMGDDDYGINQQNANARLIALAPELVEALRGLAATARTFRNVPVEDQEWTPIDDEALDNAFALLDRLDQEANGEA